MAADLGGRGPSGQHCGSWNWKRRVAGLMERLGMREVGGFDNPMLPEGHPLRRNVVYEVLAPRR